MALVAVACAVGVI